MAPAEGFLARLAAARSRLDGIPATGQGEYGAPDPESGERWNRGNVLGHLAELLPFWTDQLRAALAGAEAVGRGEAGYAQRRDGIARGTVLAEAELRSEIARGIDGLEDVLRGLDGDALARVIEYRRSSGGPVRQTVGEFVEGMLVGHLEGHLEQLESLT